MGLGAAVGSFIAPALADIGLGGTIFGAAIPDVIGSALVGSGLSAGSTLFTGGDPLTAALTGGITGGAIPAFGPALGEATGLGTTVGDALVGAGAGAGGAGLTGGNPLMGALTGGVGGLTSGLLGGGSTGTTGDAIGTTGSAAPSTTMEALPGVMTATPSPIGAGPSAAGGAAPAAAAIDPLASGLPASVNVEPLSNMTAPAGGGDLTTAGATATPSGFSTDYLSGILSNPTSYVNASPSAQVAADVQDATLGGTAPSDVTSSVIGSAPAKGGFLSNLFGGGSGGLSSLASPGLLLGAGALGLEALMQPSTPSIASSVGPISKTASTLGTQGTQLASYLQTGTLPPGVQQGITQAADAAKAQIRSRYASMGGGAETSSAAVQDMANVDTVAATQGAQIAEQLLSQGVNESQISAQLYSELLNLTLQQDQQLGNSIGAFAAAMVPRTVTTVPAATTG